MIKLKNGFLLLIIIILSSCKTYDTFYGNTDTLTSFNAKTKRLDLSYQNLNVVPKSLKNLKELKMLDLSGNTNIDLDKVLESLKNPGNLEVLILDSLHLKELPNNISLLKGLKQLSLGYNKSLDLEKTFTQLYYISLEFLNLKGNNIQRLPENIQKLKTIKDLNLSYNLLNDEVSYGYLSKLPLLYSLWLDHNDLNLLPKAIRTLDQVNYLYLDNNELKNLPEEIFGMKKLRVLHLGFNKFTEFPSQFIKVPNLIMVLLNNNQITSFPRQYEAEKYSLLSLVLDHNPIPKGEQKWVEKTFKNFFILSFKQVY